MGLSYTLFNQNQGKPSYGKSEVPCSGFLTVKGQFSNWRDFIDGVLQLSEKYWMVPAIHISPNQSCVKFGKITCQKPNVFRRELGEPFYNVLKEQLSILGETTAYKALDGLKLDVFVALPNKKKFTENDKKKLTISLKGPRLRASVPESVVDVIWNRLLDHGNFENEFNRRVQFLISRLCQSLQHRSETGLDVSKLRTISQQLEPTSLLKDLYYKGLHEGKGGATR